MGEIFALFFFGLLGFAVWAAAGRVPAAAVLALSLGFLFCVLSGPAAFLILGWVAGNYAVARFMLRRPAWAGRIFTAYAVFIVALFVLLKTGMLQTAGESTSFGDVAMPLGFSFIMLQSLGLFADIRNKKIQSVDKPLDYSAAALFFPVLPIGPFAKWSELNSQLNLRAPVPALAGGYFRLCLGAFKFGFSGLIADLMRSVPVIHSPERQLHPLAVMLFGTAYLYVNFSGYSDLVIGIAQMMGYRVPENFRFPFFSASMSEYWQKWHISLGAWFREHVYFPLAFKIGASAATFVTFLLIGLWHGISAKYFAWALLNAVLVTFMPTPSGKGRSFGILVTFVLVLFINALFLSTDLAGFVDLLRDIPSVKFFSPYNLKAYAWAVFFFAVVFTAETVILENRPAGLKWAVSALLLGLGVILGLGTVDAVYVGY